MKAFPFNYEEIPDHMMRALRRYIDHHIPVGDFLEAVISNDLSGAVARADGDNMALIPTYVCWLYNEAPALCWGNARRYDEWLDMVVETTSPPVTVEVIDR